jgi:hypothetical protein
MIFGLDWIGLLLAKNGGYIDPQVFRSQRIYPDRFCIKRIKKVQF